MFAVRSAWGGGLMAWGARARAARFMWSKRGKSSPKRAAPVTSPEPTVARNPPPVASGDESGSVLGAAPRCGGKGYIVLKCPPGWAGSNPCPGCVDCKAPDVSSAGCPLALADDPIGWCSGHGCYVDHCPKVTDAP